MIIVKTILVKKKKEIDCDRSEYMRSKSNQATE